MRKIFLTTLFAIFTPLTLGISLFGLEQIKEIENSPLPVFQKREPISDSRIPLELYSSLPPITGSFSQAVSTGDARPILIRKYLEKYNSPLLPYADFIFQVSEKYGLDHGLILAIAQCESNVCKRIPPGSYNCWGFENGETRFLSWEQAIEQVAKTLKFEYYDKGLLTPEQIMPKYAPPSVEKGGPWARCVKQFLEELH